MKKKDRRSAVDAVEAHGEEEGQAEPKRAQNNLRKMREDLLMSKAELARKAGLSALTIDRVEAGYNCRMDTKRKIILALGLKIAEKDKVFGEEA
ncbi:MAG: helix-turn-helix domain-containing protein [Deltaproteobacteria bacterium]|nr:helix-turn-helix domain-containing protein [Deltaproteobacteria bacterium]